MVPCKTKKKPFAKFFIWILERIFTEKLIILYFNVLHHNIEFFSIVYFLSEFQHSIHGFNGIEQRSQKCEIATTKTAFNSFFQPFSASRWNASREKDIILKHQCGYKALPAFTHRPPKETSFFYDFHKFTFSFSILLLYEVS